MTISWQTPGAFAYSASGGATVSPAYPAGSAEGDKLVLLVGQKPSTANGGSVTTPAGWMPVASITGVTDGNTGGYGTQLGADTGNTNLFAFERTVPAGGLSGSLAVTVGGNGVCWARICRLTSSNGAWDSVAGATGKDTAGGAAVSIAFGSDPGVAAGDLVIGAMCIPTDVSTPSQFSAETFAQAGAIFGAVTEVGEADSTTGNDIGGFICYSAVSSGTGLAAPTMTATAGGATTNVRGPGMFIRVREGLGAITGILAVTLDAAMLASAGAVAIAGSAAVTLGAATLSAAAALAIAATLAVQLDNASLAGAGTVSVSQISGTLDVALDAATLSAAGALPIAGSLARTLDDATLSAAGTSRIAGSLAVTLEPAAGTGQGILPVAGSGVAWLDAAQLVATGLLKISGAGGATLQDAALAASGALPIVGQATIVLSDATGAGAGGLALSGAGAGVLDDATLEAAGALAIAGSGAAQLEPAILAAGATLADPPPLLSLAAIESLVAAIWARPLPLSGAPVFTPGEAVLAEAELDAVSHAVWARALP